MATLTISTTTGSTINVSDADASKPYSFQEWRMRNSSIPLNEAYTYYDSYLKGWYVKRDVTNAVTIDYIQKYYITFLKTLGLAPRTPEEQVLFNNVDTKDMLSVQAAIVGYARRLKDISVYIATRRNIASYSKLKANLTGTGLSLERLFYSYLLNAFTRKITPDGIITTSFTITNPDILTSLPYLSVVSSSFDVEVEEVYDTDNYFDKEPSTNITSLSAALINAGAYSLPFNYTITTGERINTSNIAAITVATVISSAVSNTLQQGVNYFTYTGDNITTTFSLPGITSSVASDYQVSISGITQGPNINYTVSAINQTITFNQPPPIDTLVVVVIRYR